MLIIKIQVIVTYVLSVCRLLLFSEKSLLTQHLFSRSPRKLSLQSRIVYISKHKAKKNQKNNRVKEKPD